MSEVEEVKKKSFTKKIAYDLMTEFITSNKDALETAEVLNDLVTLVDGEFKPAKGGGATANPPKMVDGIEVHYCRLTELYYPIEEMVTSKTKDGGIQVKGVSDFASKYRYRLQKQIDELTKQIAGFAMKGDFDSIGNLPANVQELEGKIDLPETYLSAMEEAKAKAEAEALLDDNKDNTNGEDGELL